MQLIGKVLGIKHVDFFNEKDEHVCGYQLWVSCPTDHPAWITETEVMKIWFKEGTTHVPDVLALKPADSIIVEFNRYGKPVVTCFNPEVE